MSDEERINPGHMQVRRVLRLAGPIVLGLGVVLMMVGLGSFFSSFGSFESPRYFWCCFLGMPLVMVGLVMCQFGFMGAITRYQVGEIAPVGKDTFNYMADGTKDGVQTVASAIGSGLSQGMSGAATTARCPKCGHSNDTDAKFCDECGSALLKTCPACGESNDGDAKFCDACGTGFSD
jgi:hypothetical protein